ncbi:MAG: glycosyltransferase family 2 protein [Lachnospiraceae bacterium]|nr:glycosyltransferase family 2 protein [Lachnospiraceae bacterium]
MQVPNSEAPLISVIIPVYNVEKYLEKCLDTVLSQTYTNIEVILVNDGSSDGSGAIIDSYACKDERVRVIHLPENKGVSYARNRGIDILKGEYTIFVDADDYVEPDFLEKLYVNLKENQADISICGVDLVGFPEYVYLRKDDFPCVVSGDQAVSCMLNNSPFGQEMCNKLFDSIWVKKYPFDENIYYGEDLLFIYQILKHIHRVCYIPDKLYHYIFYGKSSSHSEFSERQYTGILVYKFLHEDLRQKHPELLSELKRRILCMNIIFAREVINQKKNKRYPTYLYLKKFQKNIRSFLSKDVFDLAIPKRTFAKIILLYISAEIFWSITVIYKKLKRMRDQCRRICS